jgi:hypothetical protein
MFELFKKRDWPSGRAGNAILTGRGAALQKNWAGWMGLQASRLSLQKQKLALLLFICLTGSYFVFLMAQSILGYHGNGLSITPLSKPAHATATGAEIKESHFPVSRAEYLKVTRFRDYMDSLARNASGKGIHDSILLARPGLMDSLTLIENYYQSKYKN